MTKATWRGTTIAESDRTVEVEGNHYFPPEDVHAAFLEASDTHTTCPWKGEASYFTVVVGEERNPDAAWVYPSTTEKARHFQGYYAFWKGVEVE